MGARAVQWIIGAALLSAGTVFSGDTTANYKPVLSGYASLEGGEIMKGSSDQTGEIQRAWLETGYMGFVADAAVSDRLRVLVGGQAQVYFSFRRTEGAGSDEDLGARLPNVFFTIINGEALYTIGSPAHPLLQLEAGFFPYKYNPEVRNLGEYLFRTYCYPSSIVDQFDYAYAQLLGFRVGNSFEAGPGDFHHDLLLTTSTTFWPFMDWSLSYLADYSIPRFFTFGAGAQLWDVFSVGVDNSQLGIDPTAPEPGLMGGRAFTFAGTKLMARFSFDPKGLFSPDATPVAVLGKEDLKLYGEGAILGLKNYPDTDAARNIGYDSLQWRLPVMVGFNVPTFKLLDVLAFEWEYQDSPYPNSVKNPYYDMLPLPMAPQPHSDVKWSLYGKKILGRHISIIGQVARDHLMPYTTVDVNEYADYTDVLLRNTDWWWTLKVRLDF